MKRDIFLTKRNLEYKLDRIIRQIEELTDYVDEYDQMRNLRDKLYDALSDLNELELTDIED